MFVEACSKDEKKNAGNASTKPIPAQMQAVLFHAPADYKGPHVQNHVSFSKLGAPARYNLRFTQDDKIWWAVPSVTADPGFPLRKRTMN